MIPSKNHAIIVSALKHAAPYIRLFKRTGLRFVREDVAAGFEHEHLALEEPDVGRCMFQRRDDDRVVLARDHDPALNI